MSFYVQQTYKDGINLQATLSSATAEESLKGEIEGGHHPITCASTLYLDEDLTMRCEHSRAPASNPRNQAILDTSIAILIFQEAIKKFG